MGYVMSDEKFADVAFVQSGVQHYGTHHRDHLRYGGCIISDKQPSYWQVYVFSGKQADDVAFVQGGTEHDGTRDHLRQRVT